MACSCCFLVSHVTYRGRIAPSPTGLLHLGHARTFWAAAERARSARGCLIFRNEDMDAARVRGDFLAASYEDLKWLGITWSEGPDVGGPFGPYQQSERISFYENALVALHAGGFIFPCSRSRRDVISAATAPHEQDGEMDEPLYPISFRPDPHTPIPPLEKFSGVNWRFRAPMGETLSFHDGLLGPQRAEVGKHFGDFLVWRKDGLPSYQLACVVDDAAMQITEVVRGCDLVTSTFRQILLYRALGLQAPAFFHCPLMYDDRGTRLAKRHDSLSLRTLREAGKSPEALTKQFREELHFP